MGLNSFAHLFISLIPLTSWGINDFLVTKISRQSGALFGGLLVNLFGFVPMIIFFPFFLAIPIVINWALLILVGSLYAFSFALFCYSLTIGKIPIVIPIITTWQLVTALLGIFILHESVSFLKVLSIFLVIGGAIVLSTNWQEIKENKFLILSPGVIPAILVSLGWGITFFLLSPLSKQQGWAFTTLATRAFTVLLLIGIYFLQTNKQSLLSNVRRIPLGLLFPIAAFDVMGISAYNLAVSRYEVSYVSIITAASPLITLGLASIFLHEKANLIQKIGIISIIGGIIGLQFG